jgi:hypothetical protein
MSSWSGHYKGELYNTIRQVGSVPVARFVTVSASKLISK